MTEQGKRLAMFSAAGAAAGLAAWRFFGNTKLADLRGQVVAITGGSRGLGLQLARDFAELGCQVAICARDREELDTAREDLESRGARVYSATCDVTLREQASDFIRNVRSQFGRLDILVTNAGVIEVGPVETVEVEDFEKAMNVMFWGTLYPILTALPEMIERGTGRIVTITSIGGRVSVPHLIPYSCAKFAAVALSEGLRTELGTKGIQVLTIIPGLMRTGSFLKAEFKGRQEDEYRWFGLGATLPGVSMDVERASHQILRALRTGKSEQILGLPAQILAKFHATFPEVTEAILAAVNRLLLPTSDGGSRDSETGHEADSNMDSPVYRALTALGRAAARRMNEYAHSTAG